MNVISAGKREGNLSSNPDDEEEGEEALKLQVSDELDK